METRAGRREVGNKRQEARDEGRETGDGRWESGDRVRVGNGVVVV